MSFRRLFYVQGARMMEQAQSFSYNRGAPRTVSAFVICGRCLFHSNAIVLHLDGEPFINPCNPDDNLGMLNGGATESVPDGILNQWL